MSGRRRRAALAALALLLVAGMVAGARASAPAAGAGTSGAGGTGGASGAAAGLPMVAATADTTAWYCAGATAQPGGQADGTLVLANGSGRVLRGSVTEYGNDTGRPILRSLLLAPWSRGTLREQVVRPAPWAAAVVVFDGPGGSVDQQVSGPLGLSVAPCATASSPDWYFPTGTTRTGTSLLLALFNPFPEDALADLSFSTTGGALAPAEFQGLYVPAGSLLMVDVGSHVVQADDVATTVAVRAGRLVAAQLQLDTMAGQLGADLVTGAPAPAARWWLPDGAVSPGVGEWVHVYNPTSRPARVRVSLDLAQGQAAPFEDTVEPGGRWVLDLAHQPRLPPNDPHATTVTSSGAGVVVERTVLAGPPSSRDGLGELLGAPVGARQWQLAAGGASSSQDEWVVVFDPGPRSAVVTVEALAGGHRRPVRGLASVVVPAGGRSAFRLGEHVQTSALSLLVGANTAVVVERDLYQAGAPGVSLAVGDPVATADEAAPTG